MRDVDLLRLEIDTLWTRDARGRLERTREREGRPAPLVVFGQAADGTFVEIGSRVPDGVGETFLAGDPGGPGTVGKPPSWPSAARGLLEGAPGAVEVSSGPSYVVSPGVHFAVDGVDFVTVSTLEPNVARPANWEAEEWEQLLEGELGPWAMAVVEAEVASLCHSARLTAAAAEAGVWTDPAHRGAGLAAAVTGAWAAQFEGDGRVLFYSTSAENVSSQRVAARLGIRCVGWLWKVEAG